MEPGKVKIYYAADCNLDVLADKTVAIIGCGSWGRTLLNRAGAVGGCEVAALCEPDANALAELKKVCSKKWGRAAIDAAKTYADYRVMFEEMGETLDAVFIATPNHHHALPALMAIRRGVAADPVGYPRVKRQTKFEPPFYNRVFFTVCKQ